MALQRSLWRVILIVCGVVLSLFHVSTAHAAEAPDRWKERPLAVHGIVAFPSGPLGLVGAEVDYAPLPMLGLSLGTGGTLAGDGTPIAKFGLGARYRLRLSEDFALSGGGTLAIGEWHGRSGVLFDEENKNEKRRHDLDTAVWGGLQLGAEYRAPLGFSLKLLFGAERMLNPNSGTCTSSLWGEERPISCQSAGLADGSFLSFAAALGYAF